MRACVMVPVQVDKRPEIDCNRDTDTRDNLRNFIV